jgi:hypothetical protein
VACLGAVASLSGNVTGGNLLSSGLISATGQLTANTLLINSNANILGNLNVQGNITFINSNVITTNDLYVALANNQSSYTNINGAGLQAGNTGSASLTNWTYGSTANAWSTNVGISATANITGGNLLTNGLISSAGTVTGSSHLGTVVSVSGTVTGSSHLGSVVSVSGTVTGSSLIGTVSTNSIINSGTSATGNIGSTATPFNTVFAQSTSALYADLAENYLADAGYAPGTVISFGGANEVTLCNVDQDVTVAGVVSSNPAYQMNDGLVGDHVTSVALVGRVPCQVVGPVTRGAMMVSAGNGQARAEANPKMGSVIGKALQSFDGAVGIIEIVVGRL